MTTTSWVRGLVLVVFSVSSMLLPLPASADDQRTIGHIKTTVGAVTLLRYQATTSAVPGGLLREGDSLQTGLVSSSATITMIDGTSLALGPQTRLVLRHFLWNPTTQAGQMRAELGVGTLAVQSGSLGKPIPGNTLAIVTPRATVRVTDAKVGLRVVKE